MSRGICHVRVNHMRTWMRNLCCKGEEPVAPDLESAYRTNASSGDLQIHI